MQKHLYYILALSIFFASNSVLGSKITEDDTDKNYHYHYSFKPAIRKVVGGSAMIFLMSISNDYLSQTENTVGQRVSEVGLHCGFAMFAEGTIELCHSVYHKFLNHVYRYKNFNKLSILQKRGQEDSRPSKIQYQHELYWNKGSNIIRALPPLYTATVLTLHSLAMLSKYDDSVNCANENLLTCNRMLIIGTVCLGGATLTYSLRELFASCKQKKLRPGEIPLMGLSEGFTILGVAQNCFYPGLMKTVEVPNSWQLQKVYKSTDEYKDDLAFYEAMCTYGAYIIFANGMQIWKNTKNLLQGQTRVSIETIPISKQVEVRKSNAKLPKPSWEPSSNAMDINSFQDSLQLVPPEQPQPLKVKVKRRGTPDSSRMHDTTSNALPNTSSSAMSQLNDTERQGLMKEVNDLRRYNAIKQKVINTLLSDTCKFVGGDIRSIDGSEHAIVFYRGSQKISIKFETPHGSDNGVYKGFKLKRALNAMETALVYNWDETSIRKYMETSGTSSFYQVPSHLLYILWTRPDL